MGHTNTHAFPPSHTRAHLHTQAAVHCSCGLFIGWPQDESLLLFLTSLLPAPQPGLSQSSPSPRNLSPRSAPLPTNTNQADSASEHSHIQFLVPHLSITRDRNPCPIMVPMMVHLPPSLTLSLSVLSVLPLPWVECLSGCQPYHKLSPPTTRHPGRPWFPATTIKTSWSIWSQTRATFLYDTQSLPQLDFSSVELSVTYTLTQIIPRNNAFLIVLYQFPP